MGGITQAATKGLALEDLALATMKNPLPCLGLFAHIRKLSVHPQQSKRIEIDLYARAEDPGTPDLAVEVKDWENPVGAPDVTAYIGKVERARGLLDRPAQFIFYSERGFTRDQAANLAEADIIACDATLLTAVL